MDIEQEIAETRDITKTVDTREVTPFEKLDWEDINFDDFESPLFDIVKEYPNAFIPIGDKYDPHFVLRPNIQTHTIGEDNNGNPVFSENFLNNAEYTKKLDPILSDLYKRPLRIDYRDSLIILNNRDIFNFSLCNDDVYLKYGEYRSLIPAVQEGYEKGKRFFNLNVHTNNPSNDYSLTLSFRTSEIENIKPHRLKTNLNALGKLAKWIDANYSKYLQNPYFIDSAN